MPSHHFRIGGWRFDTETLEIRSAADTHHLPPKMGGVLLALARREGRVVSKAKLMEDAWPGLVVSETTIRRTVSELRAVLDEEQRFAPYIETLPSKGYRLTAPVVTLREPFRTNRRIATTIMALIGILLIAVLVVGRTTALPAELVYITDDRGVETEPRLSPDEQYVAYLRAPEGSAHIDLHIQLISSGQTRAITSDARTESAASWSPDGTRLAYFSRAGSNCSVMIATVLGGHPLNVADCEASTMGSPAWSASGDAVVFGGVAHDGKAVLVRAPINGSPASFLLSETSGSLSYPAIRDDGAIAVIHDQAGSRTLVVENETNGKRIFPIGQERVRRLQWSGHELLLATAGMDPPTRMRRLSSGLEEVPLAEGRVYAVDIGQEWSAYSIPRVVTRLWLGTFGDSLTVRPLPMSGSGRNAFPSISPDGKEVAFYSDRRGRVGLWIGRIDGTAMREIGVLDGLENSPPAWTESGLVFSDRGDLYKIAIGGGPKIRLTTGDGFDTAPWFEKASGSVFFTRTNNGPSVWRLDANGKLHEVRPNAGLVGLDNGHMFIATEHGVHSKSLADEAENLLFEPEKARLEAPNWVVSADFMLGTVFTDSGANLVRLNRTGKYEMLYPFRFVPRHLSRRESQIVFVEFVQRDLDIVMVPRASFLGQASALFN